MLLSFSLPRMLPNLVLDLDAACVLEYGPYDPPYGMGKSRLDGRRDWRDRPLCL